MRVIIRNVKNKIARRYFSKQIYYMMKCGLITEFVLISFGTCILIATKLQLSNDGHY